MLQTVKDASYLKPHIEITFPKYLQLLMVIGFKKVEDDTSAEYPPIMLPRSICLVFA